MTAYALSFLAGVLTVLSPCVLPLVPVVVASALSQHRLGPVALAAGLVASSSVVGLVLAMLGFGLDRDVVRPLSATLLILAGSVLLSRRLQSDVGRLFAPLVTRVGSGLGHSTSIGWQGQFVVGLLLGAIWSPCAGPTLAAAIGLAAQRTSVASAAAVIVAFSAGAAVPLILFAYGSREALGRQATRLARLARPAMGGGLIAVGVLTLSGLDRVIESRLVDLMPAWLVDLTSRF